VNEDQSSGPDVRVDAVEVLLELRHFILVMGPDHQSVINIPRISFGRFQKLHPVHFA
jgi:hypothetical protein